MEENPVLVLFDLRGDFAEGEDDGRRLRLRQGGMLEGLCAQGVLQPEKVADAVIEGLGDERFLILPHPEVATFEQRRAGDRDRWLAGMRRLVSG